MKSILLIIIRVYWKYIPPEKRRTCIFKESCSNYVYRHTFEHGFFSGIRAFLNRFKKCRSGYQLLYNHGKIELKLADGSLICEKEISSNILDSFYKKMDDLKNEMMLNEEIKLSHSNSA